MDGCVDAIARWWWWWCRRARCAETVVVVVVVKTTDASATGAWTTDAGATGARWARARVFFEIRRARAGRGREGVGGTSACG